MARDRRDVNFLAAVCLIAAIAGSCVIGFQDWRIRRLEAISTVGVGVSEEYVRHRLGSPQSILESNQIIEHCASPDYSRNGGDKVLLYVIQFNTLMYVYLKNGTVYAIYVCSS